MTDTRFFVINGNQDVKEPHPAGRIPELLAHIRADHAALARCWALAKGIDEAAEVWKDADPTTAGLMTSYAYEIRSAIRGDRIRE